VLNKHVWTWKEDMWCLEPTMTTSSTHRDGWFCSRCGRKEWSGKHRKPPDRGNPPVYPTCDEVIVERIMTE
jgi:hypothetical protein